MTETTEKKDIRTLKCFSILSWYYREKNNASAPNEVSKRMQYHGALVMFTSMHGVMIDETIDALVIDNMTSEERRNA